MSPSINRSLFSLAWLALMSLAASVALSGCSGLLSSEKPGRQIFLLQPYSAGQPGQLEAGKPELALRITAIPGLDTDRILALGNDSMLVPYANARWVDNLPEVLASVTRRSLESSGNFSRIVEGVDGQWRLELEIQSFYGRRSPDGATNSVSTVMQGSLHCGDQERPLRLAHSSSVSSQNLSSIVRSHQAGVDSMMGQLADALADHCH
jgi:ABC-type uncharacterized transport system auxiliary subunit